MVLLPKSTLEYLNEAFKESFRGKISVLFFWFIQQHQGEIVRSSHEQEKTHAILTCRDPRIDNIVDREIKRIRSEGGTLHGKDILRPAGGVHLLAGKTDCRKAFYEMITGLRDIAGTCVFHIWPHTNCQYCGIHFQEKLGNDSQSDLRFHVRSAEKMLSGAMNHFSNSTGQVPELDVRIILTIDQHLVTIAEAHQLLPHVPEQSRHGDPCIHQSHARHQHVHSLLT